MKPNQARIFAVFCVLLAGFGVWKLRRTPEKVADTATTEVVAGDEEKPAAPIAVEIARATLRPMESTLLAQGVLTPGQGASARVAPPVAGKLVNVFVREGQTVSAGQLLALLDNRAARAQTGSAIADVAAAEADVNSANLATRATQSDVAGAVRQAALAVSAASQARSASVRQAQEELRQAQNDLQRAQTAARAPDAQGAVDQAKLAVASAQAERDSAVQQAQNVLAQAQTELKKLKAGARPQEIAQAERAVASAQATRERAATEVERVKFLFDKGIKPRRDLDDAQTSLRVAEAGLQSAQDALSLLQAGPRAEESQAAQLTIDGAQQALEAAKNSGDAKISEANAALTLAEKSAAQAGRSRPEDVRAAGLKVEAARAAVTQAQASGDAQIAGAQAALEGARATEVQIGVKAADAEAKRAAVRAKQADLAAAQVAASTFELRAPLSGVVTKRNLNPGDIADTTAPVVEIANTRSLDLVANVSAASGAAIRAGQSARVTAESAPGRSFAAQVANVGQVDPQTGLLTLRLAVFDARSALRIGAFAKAEVVLRTNPLAVVVPKAAILSREGKSLVMRAGNDNKAHETEVVTGAERGGFVEIVSGLRTGERIIPAGQYQLDDGAPIEVKGAGARSR